MACRGSLFICSLALCYPLSSYSNNIECITVVVSGSESRDFWSQVIEGAIKAGKELGVTIHARSTYDDLDSTGQKIILNSTMEKYACQGVVIAPSDASRNQDISRLYEAGIPTVYIDRDTGGDRLAVVKTDNYLAGVLAASKMVEALEGKTRVALFRLREGVSSTEERELGFIDEAQRNGLEIISDVYLGTRIGEARWLAGETLEKLDSIDGIFTPNDTTTIGVIKALENNPQHSNVIHIGFDEHSFIHESFIRGSLHGYIVQQPFEMGYQGVHTLHKALKGELPVTDSNTPVLYFGSAALD